MITRSSKLFIAAFIALPLFALGAATTAQTPAAAATKPAKPQHVSHGEPVKLADFLVPGKTVVFDFYSDYCPPCRQIAPALEKLHAQRADIVVVKVDINRPGTKGIDWQSPVAKQFNLRSIPHFKVYSPQGKLLAEDTRETAKAREMVMGWIK